MKGSLSSTNNINSNNRNNNFDMIKNQTGSSNINNEFLIPLIRETTKISNNNNNNN